MTQQVPQGPVIGPTQQTTIIGLDRRQRPGVLAILFGIFTILVSIGLAATSLLGGLGAFSFDAEAGLIVLALSCVPLLFALYGLFSGAMLTFVGGAVGKVFAIIYWAILIVGGICVGAFGALIFAALGFEGY